MCRFENLMLNIIKLTKQFPLLNEFSLSFSWLSHGKVCLINLKLFVLYFPNSANQLTQLLAIIHVHLKTFCDLKVWKNDNLNERLISLDWIFQAYLSPVSWSTLTNQTNRYFNHEPLTSKHEWLLQMNWSSATCYLLFTSLTVGVLEVSLNKLYYV